MSKCNFNRNYLKKIFFHIKTSETRFKCFNNCPLGHQPKEQSPPSSQIQCVPQLEQRELTESKLKSSQDILQISTIQEDLLSKCPFGEFWYNKYIYN